MTDVLMEMVQPVIGSVVGKWCRKLPYLDRSELLGEAQIVALKAVQSHNPDKASIETWVHLSVWKYISEMATRKNWQRRFCKGGCEPVESPKQESFSLESLLKEVSEEAATAVTLAVGLDMKKTELRKTLRQEFGWEWSEINRVFDEIREALS